MLKYRFTSLAILALALSFSLTTSAAETKSSKSPGKPQAKKPRPKPVVSPLLFGDGRLTFQVSAPNAKEVFLTGQMLKTKRILLGKDGRGIWSATIAPVAPGVYEYSFLIDGQKTIDPGNSQIKPMRSPRSSILHIRGNESERHHADFRNDIPHGTVHYHSYHSLAINRFRELEIYTPPGYETSNERYPLLVLQHGHSDSYATWTRHGKAHWILDNLIADGKAMPMIVVMADGHPVPESYGGGRSVANTEELRKDLLEAVLPMVEKNYRVKPGRGNRAITGLSMGGLHSLAIGLTEMDEFGWVGAFSAACPDAEAVASALKDSANTNVRLKLLWIAIGKKDFLLKENRRFRDELKEAGVKHVYRETEGSHSWPVWRGYLAEFAPLLFQ
ncbi:MAG: enterochelin esterase-like enzyme [Candidatus Binatia bacterium]|jgi:enterochelin esterase-like enzyme